MFRVGKILQLALDHRQGGRADLLGPVEETSWRLFPMLTVGTGHMFRERGEEVGVATGMRGDALAFVEHLHDRSGGTHVQPVTDPTVRDAVVALVHLNVVIDTGFGLLPLGVIVEAVRQRLERGFIQ